PRRRSTLSPHKIGALSPRKICTVGPPRGGVPACRLLCRPRGASRSAAAAFAKLLRRGEDPCDARDVRPEFYFMLRKGAGKQALLRAAERRIVGGASPPSSPPPGCPRRGARASGMRCGAPTPCARTGRGRVPPFR